MPRVIFAGVIAVLAAAALFVGAGITGRRQTGEPYSNV
jgi:hypothetical protein